MKILFLLNGVLFFGIFVSILINFVKHQDDQKERIARLFAFIGLVYLLFSISSILWAFEILDYSEFDFLFLYSVSLIFQSLMLFRIVYLFSKNKRLFYFLGFCLITLLYLIVVFHNVIVFSFLFSFFFSLFRSLEFIFIWGNYRNVGYFGILYSGISLILHFFLFYDSGSLYFFSLASNFLFLVFLFVFFKDLEKYKIRIFPKLRKERSYFLSLLGHLIFIITLTNFIFIGTIGIHEFGHYGVSKFYDCEYRKIVYEDDLFHTEVLCEEGANSIWVVLGGILFPLLIAILLFLIGGTFMQEIAILIVGFNLISISKDFLDLGISNNFILGVVFLGALAIIYGIFLLAKSRTEEELYFYGGEETEKAKKYIKKILAEKK